MSDRRRLLDIGQRTLLLALLWWIVSEGAMDGLATGFGLLAVGAALSLSLALIPAGVIHRPRLRFQRLPGFLAFFVWNSVLGGLQVARLALQPRAQPQPGLIELELELPAGAPRVLMANALGLMPGTLGVRLDGQRLSVHLLDARRDGHREANALEARIAQLFETRP